MNRRKTPTFIYARHKKIGIKFLMTRKRFLGGIEAEWDFRYWMFSAQLRGTCPRRTSAYLSAAPLGGDASPSVVTVKRGKVYSVCTNAFALI